MNNALSAWRKLEAKPFGKVFFSRFIPESMRWLPRGMTVDVPATVEMQDDTGEVVCRATITMWVSPGKK